MKRFYREVSLGRDEAGWRVLLDGRAVKTVGGRAQTIPTAALAEAMAAEWAEQGDEIELVSFAFRDLADYALDVVAPGPAAAVAGLLAYAETDTLCYRAEPDTALAARQAAVWEPLLAGAEAAYGVRFTRVCGVIHRPQPATTLARLGEELAAQDTFALAALHTMTSLAASLVVGLAALKPDTEIGALWDAAELEEGWQAELWGRDAEAEARRTRRRAAFINAARFARLATS